MIGEGKKRGPIKANAPLLPLLKSSIDIYQSNGIV
jgi:hypothetical protein